jgi:Protein of unknown function (DUF3179)
VLQPLGAVRRGVWGIMLTVVLVVQCLLVAAFVAHDRAERRRELDPMNFSQNPGAWLVDNDSKPIVRPRVIAANEAALRPEELVIGVEAAGHPRAYRLAALEDPRRHVVNDLIGGVPVSVVYCNLTQCLRVYTDSAGFGPLDVEIAGLFNGEMVVRLRGGLYLQNSGAALEPTKSPPSAPYRLLAPELATWSEWAARHPDTDAYVGP